MLNSQSNSKPPKKTNHKANRKFNKPIRHYMLLIHRYSGLVMAVFLLITALSGIMIAFLDELDDWINRDIAYIQTSILTDTTQPDVSNKPIPIGELHDIVEKTYSQLNFSSFPSGIEPNRTVKFWVGRSKDKANKPDFNLLYIHPYTGQITGTRNTKKWQWSNTMWKTFWLHRNLLTGKTGQFILGITALIWTVNCFIGFYLTFPRSGKKKGANNQDKPKRTPRKRKSWLKRWLPAWKIRRKTNTFKLNYDLHNALGLWLWVFSFAIAWSSVAFNLQEVYDPVMKTVVGYESHDEKTEKPKGLEKNKDVSQEQITNSKLPAINKYNSIQKLKAASLINAQEQGDGLYIKEFMGVRWHKDKNEWQIRFRTNKDIGKKSGASSLTLDAITGEVIRVRFGHDSTVGQKIHYWLTSLHMGDISFGMGNMAYRVFLALFGLVVIVLTVTGIYLWLKARKRGKRRKSRLMIQGGD